jgi:T-complex protein 1 subunit theta
MGDSTNTVIILVGERRENLLVMDLHPGEIIKGYELACAKALAERLYASPTNYDLRLRTPGLCSVY